MAEISSGPLLGREMMTRMAFLLVVGGEVFHRVTRSISPSFSPATMVSILRSAVASLGDDLRLRAAGPGNFLVRMLAGAEGEQRNAGKHDLETPFVLPLSR